MSGDPDDTRSYDLREYVPDKFHLVDEDYGMRNRGENVKLVPKADIIHDHLRQSAAWTPWTDNFFVYSKHDPPCSAPLSSLQPIFVKDLKLGCDYRETVAVLRTITPPRRLGDSLQTVVEDEQGTCIYLRIYGPVVATHIGRFLPEGSVVAVKAPWCLCNKKFGTAMVVHYLTDFVRLVQGGILYPTKWNLLVPPSAPSASEWFKEEGNNAYKSQKYQTAVVRYTEALNFKPNESLKIAIYSNRAQAHLACGAFEAAIADSTFVLSHEPQHEKALYRCAIGHYEMKNYATAIDLLKSLIEAYPSNETAKNDLRRAMQRVNEQKTGAYDFADMLKVSRGPCPQMDVADYIGPVKQEAGGFFATRDITAGELLMVTKSFEFLYATIGDGSVYYNSKTCCGSNTASLRLSRKIAQKLVSNPSYLSSFKKLHSPSPTISADISDELIDGRPVINEYLIESILKPHVFAMPCVHGSKNKYSGIGWSFNGSYIRHDCLGNCTRAAIGDVAIYRASRDIEMGAEILVPYVSTEMSVKNRQKRLQSFGIDCTCRLCQSQLAEIDNETDKQRRALLDTAPDIDDMPENPVKAAREIDQLCTRVESTYADPPTIHPRFSYMDQLAALSLCCTMTASRKKLLETSLRGLSIMGFETQVDETGHLQILRYGHCGRYVLSVAVLQASWLTHEELLSEAASWKALARKSLDILEGHWSFHTKPLTQKPMHPIDLSDSG